MKYDRQQAIEKATEVFWQLGFQGSKMRDLQSSMDMRPGSIYAGFGSKEGLFKSVLEHYIQGSLTSIDHTVAIAENPLQGLHGFFSQEFVADGQLNDKPICLLIKVVSELEESEPALARLAQQGMDDVIERFRVHLSHAQQEGLLSADADCQQLAKWLQMQMMGLRLYSKNHPTVDDVTAMIDTVFNNLRMH